MIGLLRAVEAVEVLAQEVVAGIGAGYAGEGAAGWAVVDAGVLDGEGAGRAGIGFEELARGGAGVAGEVALEGVWTEISVFASFAAAVAAAEAAGVGVDTRQR